MSLPPINNQQEAYPVIVHPMENQRRNELTAREVAETLVPILARHEQHLAVDAHAINRLINRTSLINHDIVDLSTISGHNFGLIAQHITHLQAQINLQQEEIRRLRNTPSNRVQETLDGWCNFL